MSFPPPPAAAHVRRRTGTLLGLAALASAVGVAWAVGFAGAGLRLSSDSALFLDRAVGLHARGVLDLPASRAPLHPLALAALMVATPAPATAAAVLAGLSLGVFLLLVGRIALRVTGDGIAAVLALLIAASWPASLLVFEVAWTEQVFVALLLGHAWFVLRHAEGGAERDHAAAGACLSLAALTRYAGIPLLALYALETAWLGPRTWRGWTRVALAPVPLGLWMLRNVVEHGSPMGRRPPSDTSAFLNLQRTADTVQEALAAVHPLGWLAAIGLAVLLHAAGTRRDRVARAALLVLGALPLLHQLGVGWAASRVRLDAIGPRFVAPALPFLVLLAVVPLRRDPLPAKWRGVGRVAGLAALLVASAHALGPLGADLDVVAARGDAEVHHLAAGFDHSRTARDLGALLAAESAMATDLVVGVLDRGTSSYRALSLLYRPGIWRGGDLSLRGFDAGPDGALLVRLDAGGEPRTIRAVGLGPYRGLPQLRRRFETLARVADDGPALVLAYRGALGALSLDDLAPLLPRGRRAEPLLDVPPYRAWRVSPADDAGARRRPLSGDPPHVVRAD